MIVTCEQCETSFQLDESRIPATGARVRCSRCKHAFFLANPSASQAQVADSIAAEAAEGASGIPEPTRDVNEDTWDGLNGASPVLSGDTQSGTSSATEPLAPSTPEPELEEEDWEFTEEIRTEADDADDALGADLGADLESGLGDGLDAELSADFGDGFDDAALGGETASAESPAAAADSLTDPAGGLEADALSADSDASGIDLASTGEPEIASVAQGDAGGDSGLDLGGPEPAPIGEEPGHDESSFGSVDDFSSLMEDDQPVGDVASQLGNELAAELDSASATESVGTYSERGQTDDLGDPESWDLVGGDDLVAAGAAAAPARAQSLVSELDAASADDFFNDVADEAAQAPDFAAASQSFASGPIGRAARAVGWLVTVAALAFVAQLAFVSETGRWSEGPVSVSAGPLSARTEEGGWLRTTRTGAVLRVAGEVENTSGATISPGRVQLVLLDAAGESLGSPPVPGGVPLAARVLREAEAAVLLEQAAASARRFTATPMAPGETRRFEVLIPQDRLPEDAARFDLEFAPAKASPGRAPSAARAQAASTPAAPERAEEAGAQPAESPSLP